VVSLKFCFNAYVKITEGIEVGPVSTGTRYIVPITGGLFEGEKLKGEVLPGGADWQLVRKDGSVEVEARYTLRTDDGVPIYVMNKGIICDRYDPTIAYARAAPSFEVTGEKYAWLTKTIFVSEITPMIDETTPLTIEEHSEISAVSINVYQIK
jgi:Protein of unknown function (DUF3237)